MPHMPRPPSIDRGVTSLLWAVGLAPTSISAPSRSASRAGPRSSLRPSAPSRSSSSSASPARTPHRADTRSGGATRSLGRAGIRPRRGENPCGDRPPGRPARGASGPGRSVDGGDRWPADAPPRRVPSNGPSGAPGLGRRRGDELRRSCHEYRPHTAATSSLAGVNRLVTQVAAHQQTAPPAAAPRSSSRRPSVRRESRRARDGRSARSCRRSNRRRGPSRRRARRHSP